MNIVEIIIRGVDQATKPLTAPIKSLRDLQSVASKLGPVVAATAGALGTAFVGLARHAINLQDETGKLAQKAGTTAEAFSTLAYASKINDVSNEWLSTGFRKLNQEIVAVASGTASARSGLVQLGIAVKDAEGNLRPGEQVLLDVAAAFKGMQDGSVKSALALDIFGKSGTELIPLLNQGRDGIEQLQAEARRLGVEVSSNTAVAADQFNDDLARLGTIARGLQMQVAAALLPTLSRLTHEFTNNAVQSRNAASTAQDIATAFRIVATTGLAVWHSFKFIANIIATAITVNFGVAVDLTRGLVRSFNALVEGLQESGRKLLDFGKTLGGVGSIIAAVLKGEFAEAKKAAETFFADFTAKGKEALSANNTESVFAGITSGVQNAMRNAAAVQIEGFNRITADAVNYKKAYDAIWDTTQLVPQIAPQVVNPPPLMVDETALLKFEEKRAEALMRARDMERQLAEEILTGAAKVRAQLEGDFLKRNEQIAQLQLTEDEALELSAKNYEAYQAKLRQLDLESAKQRQQIMMQHAQSVSEIFGNMASAAKAFGKKGFQAWKAFATAQAIIDTYAAANKAYSALAGIPIVGPALGAAAAAAAIAAGFANVSHIQSAQPAGQAHGGLNYVPSTGTYVLEQGERVIKTKQNEDLTEALENGGLGPKTVNIQVTLDDRILGEALYDLSRNGRVTIHPRAVRDTRN